MSTPFTHKGTRYFISFRCTYNGQAFYDVHPHAGESMEIVITMGHRRPDPQPKHYPNDAARQELARAAYCAHRKAQRAEWREWAPRKGYKNIGAMLHYARRSR